MLGGCGRLPATLLALAVLTITGIGMANPAPVPEVDTSACSLEGPTLPEPAVYDPSSDPIASLDAVTIEDRFGRSLDKQGISLTDWEGFVANPAIPLFLTVKSTGAPIKEVTITADAPRLYLNQPSTVGPDGPRKDIIVETPDVGEDGVRIPFRLGIFPDRDGHDETHSLTIRAWDATRSTEPVALAERTVHVEDHDTSEGQRFQVHTDYSEDELGFFDDAAKRAVVDQAAADWASVISPMDLDRVPAGEEDTWIWEPTPSGYGPGHVTTNDGPYTGFLLYPYGFTTPTHRAGGEPSPFGDPQTSDGQPLPLSRSGGIQLDIHGNYNTLGWLVTTDEDTWWDASNLEGEPNDLYSISHHEMAHALGFNPTYPIFGQYKEQGEIDAARIVDYHGEPVEIDGTDHTSAIDRLSLRPAYGNEYDDDASPLGRWIPTKLDLLILDAIGYELVDVLAFQQLDITSSTLPSATVDQAYHHTLSSTGAIPPHAWHVVEGELPPGLCLDRVTGEVRGTPSSQGTFEATVSLDDQDPQTGPVEQGVTIEVGP